MRKGMCCAVRLMGVLCVVLHEREKRWFGILQDTHMRNCLPEVRGTQILVMYAQGNKKENILDEEAYISQ